MTNLMSENPMPVEEPSLRPVTKKLTPSEWVKENLFGSVISGFFTIIFGLIFIQLFVFNITDALFQREYELGVITNWLLSNDYEILRVNLRLWMVGRFPKEEVWRPVVAMFLISFTFALASGALFETSRRRAIEAGAEPPTSSAKEWLRRGWPILALAFVLCMLSETWRPWANVGVTLGLAVAGRWIGKRLPEFVRSWAWWFPLAGLGSAIIVMQGQSFRPLAAILVGLAIAVVPKLVPPDRGPFIRWPIIIGSIAIAWALAVALTEPLNDLVGDPGADWDDWGGLMVNLLVAISGIVIAFPLGLILALGRRGSRPAPEQRQTMWIGVVFAIVGMLSFIAIFGTAATVKPLGLVEAPFAAVAGAIIGGAIGGAISLSRQSTTPFFWAISVIFIEFIRGVPLITLLFFGDTMLLFFFPKGFQPPSQVSRAMIVVTAFSAAYIAEIVRGGLQSVDKGQIEAAQAVGLPVSKVQRLIVLPQALRAVIPAMVGQFISLWKDTSLLSFIGLTEILQVSKAANSQPAFQGQGLQDLTLMFVALIFWVVAYTMSRESQRLEMKLRVAER